MGHHGLDSRSKVGLHTSCPPNSLLPENSLPGPTHFRLPQEYEDVVLRDLLEVI